MLLVEKVTKEYPSAAGPLRILSGVDLAVLQGEAVAIVGPSGSGKSTLMHILGALDEPTLGTVSLAGENPFTLSEPELARFRNRRIGFMFQDHCLLPQCTVLENVLTPAIVADSTEDFPSRARDLLARVGLGERLSHRPPELSGGERQRAALARALIRHPLLMLCDEPTGNLDRAAAQAVADLLFELHHQQKNILIVVTHSGELAARFPRRYQLLDQALQPV